MSSRKTDAVQKHRTLWLSDLHLGSPACKADRIVRFLRHNDCEQLYLVGDVIDGWKLKSRFYWTADHTRVIKAILAKARRGTKVYYLTGNHDDFMRQFVKARLQLGPIQIMHERVHTTADGRKLLVTHGDRFDNVVNAMPTLAMLGDFAYEGLLNASARLDRLRERFGVEGGGFSPSAFAKNTVKSFVQWLSGFDEAIYFECRKRGLNGVICGHTHHAESRHVRNGVMSYNCGDWVESCTALSEDAQGRLCVLQDTAPRVERAVRAPLTLVAPAVPVQQPALRPAATAPAAARNAA